MSARVGAVNCIVYVNNIKLAAGNDKPIGAFDKAHQVTFFIVLNDVFIFGIGYKNVIFGGG